MVFSAIARRRCGPSWPFMPKVVARLGLHRRENDLGVAMPRPINKALPTHHTIPSGTIIYRTMIYHALLHKKERLLFEKAPWQDTFA